ncbi:MAG: LysM peptidoglycan-binding domain-containing protein [Chloroflexi bacterium]|nr:LysM peptidoglycan-binding domain-containing protein [Chloroflexota bacterium]MBU1751903.1 LysM peptidoglycan-binding domain-containing protein [Chloroflexota bacterium]
MLRLSVIIPILLILAILAVGAYWIVTGSAAHSTGTTTPVGGNTPVGISAASTGTKTPTPRSTAVSAAGAPTSLPAGDVQLASNEILYQVRQGDTLWSLAIAYDTTVEVIAQRNGLANPNLIYVGQQLVIPKGVAPTPTPSGQVVYFVVWGDTLWDIAARYGTTVDAIAAMNNITDPNRIYVGQRLVIPMPASG